MKAAVYLKNGVICKTNNLQKKLKKEKEPIEILEEWLYNNDNQKLDEKYNYWCRTITPTETQKEDSVKFYYFKNVKTGYTITSIYPHLDNIPKLVKEEWVQFEK